MTERKEYTLLLPRPLLFIISLLTLALIIPMASAESSSVNTRNMKLGELYKNFLDRIKEEKGKDFSPLLNSKRRSLLNSNNGQSPKVKMTEAEFYAYALAAAQGFGIVDQYNGAIGCVQLS